MKTSHKILIPLFSVLLILSLVLVYFISNGTIRKKYISDSERSNIDYSATDFSELNPLSTETDAPLMPTDFDGIFYSLSADGKVSFYEAGADGFIPYSEEVKTLDVAPELTYNKIPIKIYYITENGTDLGYGLFTTKNSDADIKAYSYVFAKMITAPTIYKVKGHMLMVNTNPDDAFALDKKYTDIFSVNDNGACENILGQRDRSADKTGRLTERWGILTDGSVRTADKKASLISGRLYDSDTETYDIFNLNKSMNAPETKGMYTAFLREDSDSGLVYLKKTGDGFKSVKFIAEEKDIALFTGDLKQDYVISGNWIYSQKDETFTNLLTGDSFKAKNLGHIDAFAVNSDATKFAATASYNNQAFFVIDTEGNVKSYSGTSIFNKDVNNICFAGKDSVVTTSVTADGKCVNYLIKL